MKRQDVLPCLGEFLDQLSLRLAVNSDQRIIFLHNPHAMLSKFGREKLLIMTGSTEVMGKTSEGKKIM